MRWWTRPTGNGLYACFFVPGRVARDAGTATVCYLTVFWGVPSRYVKKNRVLQNLKIDWRILKAFSGL